jgi:hypothetical protein
MWTSSVYPSSEGDSASALELSKQELLRRYVTFSDVAPLDSSGGFRAYSLSRSHRAPGSVVEHLLLTPELPAG